MEIRQSLFLRGKRRLHLLPDDRVEIEINGEEAASQFTEPLRSFDESPACMKKSMWKAWPGMVIFGLLFVNGVKGSTLET